MKQVVLYLLLVTVIQNVTAQKFDWVSFTPLIDATAQGGSGGISNTVDAQGNIYTVAVFNDPIVVGNDTLYHVGNLSRPDILITKWSAQGEVLSYRHLANWSSNGSPDPQVIMYDEVHDEILLTINSYYSGMQVTLLSNGVEPDTLLTLSHSAVLRLNTDLSFVSQKNLPGGGSNGTPSGVKDGFLYTAQGYFNAEVSKTDESGNVLWSVSSSGSSFSIADMAIGSNDTIFVVGYVNGTNVSMGGKTVIAPSSGNGNNVVLFKLDTAGNVIQGIYLTQASYYLFPLRLVTDLAGNVYVASTYEIPQLAIGNLTLSINPDGRDVFIVKLSPDLVPLWAKGFSSVGDNMAHDIVVHPSGTIMLLADYNGTTPIANYTFPVAQGSYLVQFDNSTGNVLYAESFGPTASASSNPNSVTVVGNKYYISGTSYGSNEYSSQVTASYGCFDQTRNRQFLTCFNDTVQPSAQTDFRYIREQNKVYFSSGISSGQFVSIDFGDGTSTTTQKNPTHVYGKGFFNAVLTTAVDCYETKDSLQILFSGIQSVAPNRTANAGYYIANIKGGFPFANNSGVSVSISLAGSNIAASEVIVADSGLIFANFLFNNKPVGFYDVIVTGPGGFADTLKNGLELVPKTDLPLSVQISATPNRLVNRYVPCTINVSNPANFPKFGVPVYIMADARQTIGLLSNTIIRDSAATIVFDSLDTDFYTYTDTVTNDSVLFGAFIIPVIEAGSSEQIHFFIKGNVLGSKPIMARVGPPIFDSVQLVEMGLRTSCDFLAGHIQCFLDIGGQVPVLGCATSALSLGCAIGNIARDLANNRAKNNNKKRMADVFNLVADIAGVSTCEGGAFLPREKVSTVLAEIVADLLGTSANVLNGGSPDIGIPGFGPSAPGSCADFFGQPLPEVLDGPFFFADVSSMDPNDKTGPIGNTPENYTNGENVMHYTIRFENVDTATAPASTVEIKDTLDASFFDLSTFRFTGYGFADLTAQVINTRYSFAEELDLRPAKNTILRLEAQLDTNSNIISWKFNSYDPLTRELVANPSDGFLNPNVTSPEGEGFVSFSVKPKVNRPHLQSVTNRAKIVFDANAPIITNAWPNTVDKVKPTSSVSPTATMINDSTFTISWSGADAHSGVLWYDIYVTLNDTLTFPLFRNTRTNTATIFGKPGYNYKFSSRAMDWVGNLEDSAATPDAVVTLQEPSSIGLHQHSTTNDGLRLFPNPANNTVRIELPTAENFYVEVFSLLGAKMNTTFKLTDTGTGVLNVSDLAGGVYQVRVITATSVSCAKPENTVVSKKLVISR